jgi:hypothetical protein
MTWMPSLFRSRQSLIPLGFPCGPGRRSSTYKGRYCFPDASSSGVDIGSGALITMMWTKQKGVSLLREKAGRQDVPPSQFIAMVERKFEHAPVDVPGTGRDYSAWIGITPRAHSSDGKERLGKISKQGNEQLRTLLIVGSTSILKLARRGAKLPAWLVSLMREDRTCAGEQNRTNNLGTARQGR